MVSIFNTTIYHTIKSVTLQIIVAILAIVISSSLLPAQQHNANLDEDPTSLHIDANSGDINTTNNTLGDTIIFDKLLSKVNKYISHGNLDSSTILIDELEYLKQQGGYNNNRIHLYYYLRSRYFGLRSDNIQELNNILEARKYLQPGDIVKEVNVNQAIAIIYYRIFDFQSCLDIYENNAKLLPEEGYEVHVLFNYYGIANSHIQLENYDIAKQVCFEAIEHSERTEITSSIGFIYSLLGMLYINESKVDSAQYYLDKGLSISKKQNETKEIYDNYSKLAELELLKGDTLKALEYGNIAVDNPIFHELDLINTLAQIYSSQQNFEAANKLLNENIEHYEKFTSKSSINKVVSSLMTDKFDQERAIQLAQQEKEYQKKKNRNITITAIALLLGLLFIIASQIINKQKIEKINENLIDKNNNLEQFAYICSHDLKEPIVTISSFTNLLKADLSKEALDKNYDEYFSIINKETQFLDSMVNSLKTYTELNREAVLTNSEFSLQSVINDTKATFKQLDENKNVTINFNNDIEDDSVFSSKDGIKTILKNMIENAIKHNHSRELLITINASKLNNDILLTVEDNGIGIPKEHFEHIFMPFKTLNNKSQTDSSGLGLAICNRIINILGGKIWLESEIGKGSKFYIQVSQ